MITKSTLSKVRPGAARCASATRPAKKAAPRWPDSITKTYLKEQIDHIYVEIAAHAELHARQRAAMRSKIEDCPHAVLDLGTHRSLERGPSCGQQRTA